MAKKPSKSKKPTKTGPRPEVAAAAMAKPLNAGVTIGETTCVDHKEYEWDGTDWEPTGNIC